MKHLERVKKDIAGINNAMELAGYLDGIRTATLAWCKEHKPDEVYKAEQGSPEVTVYGTVAYLESEVK